MRFLGIDSTCRASFYIYNTKEDVDKLINISNIKLQDILVGTIDENGIFIYQLKEKKT